MAIAAVFTLWCGCAALEPRAPSPLEAARSRVAEAMRRAPRVATQNLSLTSTCLVKDPSTVRSLTPSSTCLSCHDGTSAAPTRVHDTHPVAVDYDGAWRRGAAALRAIDDVPPQIVLVTASTVECTSCHDPGSTLPHFTALSLDRSTLCTGCHAR
jgi:predicted CXXCH cytochrome family protein